LLPKGIRERRLKDIFLGFIDRNVIVKNPKCKKIKARGAMSNASALSRFFRITAGTLKIT
jgi:hypothetical protein